MAHPSSPLRYWGVLNTIRRPPEMVWRGLRSFLKQSTRPEKIFFIDQNETPMVLPPDLAACGLIVHHHQPVPSVGLARNLVPRGLATDWIVLCDDDGFLAEDYTQELEKIILANPNLELVAGPYINETDGKFYSVRHEWGGRLDTILGTKLLMGSNIAIRPRTFDRIGRYDIRFGPGSSFPSSDETDLCWKAYTAHVPMIYSSKIRVYHPPAHAANTEDAVRKAYNYGRGKGALAAKWMIERPSIIGYYEFVEMNVIPFLNMVRGCLRGDVRQIRIQWAVLRGRYHGFFQFLRLVLKARP